MELYQLPIALMAVVSLHIIRDVVATPNSNCSTNVDILDCHRRNLDRIPTIPSTVTTVNLESNCLDSVDSVESESFEWTTSLSILYLDNKLIQNIQVDWGRDFNMFNNLRRLSMNCNLLTALHNATFAGLGSLRSLFLSQNKITTLSPGWCDGVGNITILDLSENKISSISRDSWCLFTNLALLNLSSNEIFHLQSNWTMGMTQLKYLNLQNNDLQALNNGSFSFLSSLLLLQLRNNSIKTVDNGWGRDLGKLTEIQLSKNKLKKLPPNLFYGMVSLSRIDMQAAAIKTIHGDSFKFLEGLEEMLLQYNSITIINEGDFLDMRSVERLTLQSNKIYRLEPRSFRGMASLVELYLNNNRIQTLLGETFAGLDRLTHLYLQSNNIGSLGECWNVDLNNVIYIDMRRNNISVIENGLSNHSHCTNNGPARPADIVSLERGRNESIRDTIQENTRFSLKTFFMSRNPLGPVLHRELFKGLVQLHYLILAYCRIESVEGLFFTGLQSLKYLDLSHNNIVQLDSGSFESVPSLVAINVQSNEIKVLGPKTFSGRHLSFVDLRDNDLQTLSRNVFPERIINFELRLSQNPMICDCRITWLHKLIRKDSIGAVDLTFLSTVDFIFRMSTVDVPLVKCTNMNGHILSTIPQTYLPCHPSLGLNVTTRRPTVPPVSEFPKVTSARSEISTKDAKDKSSANSPVMSTLHDVNRNTGPLAPDSQNDIIPDKATTKSFSNTNTLVIVGLFLVIIILFAGKQLSQCGHNCRNISIRARSVIYQDINNSLVMKSSTRSLSGDPENDCAPDETDHRPRERLRLTMCNVRPVPPPPPPRHEDFEQITTLPLSIERLALQRPGLNPVIHRKRVVKHTYFRRSLGDVEIRDGSFPTLTQDLEAKNNDNEILAKPAIRHLYFRNLVTAASANRQVRTNIQENRSHRFVTEALIHERPAGSTLVTGEANPSNQSLCETIVFVDRDGILSTSHDSDLNTYGTSNTTSFRSDDFERDRESHENGDDDGDTSGVIVFDTEIIDCADQDELSARSTDHVVMDELDLASYRTGSTSDIDLSSLDMSNEDNCTYGLDTFDPGDFKKLSRHGYLLGLTDDDSRLEQESLNFTEGIFQETSV